jgi:sugar phosphate isomerase/epimerase
MIFDVYGGEVNEQWIRDRLGICSWSLHAKDPADLIGQTKQLNLKKVQLNLGPVIQGGAWSNVGADLKNAGITLASGMMGAVGEDYSSIANIRRTGGVVPDATWPATLENMKKAAPIAQQPGLKLVTLHAGFIPQKEGDPAFDKVVDRIRTVADVFKKVSCAIALETGQEKAPTLHRFLHALSRPDIGVNFDPANMILYSSGDPIEALTLLMPHVKQIHIKDATGSGDPEAWGKEVPVGTGDVDWPAFFGVCKQHGYDGNFIIEREAGDQRIVDINKAQQLLFASASKVV